ncbi:hypothetical protein [Candidatus Methylomirabilis sp.]|uniref:hypothetical protein n=1 Tax=Candidatus Methylomirabilis sp. TaxID=2032687 RepID=UPI003C75B9D2
MSEKKTTETALHKNPFWALGLTTRDDRHRIVAHAEERALLSDHNVCQRARADLTNPKARLSWELAWMPGVAPRMAEKILRALSENPVGARDEEGLPELAKANLMASALELVSDDEPASSVAEFIRDFAWVVESIDPDDLLRDVNEDRAISGFPEVRGIDIEEELTARRKAYRNTLKNLLDTMAPEKLIESMTRTVDEATDGGTAHGPALIDELVDSYEVETQGFLEKGSENIATLIKNARAVAPKGEQAVEPIIDKLAKVARNWDRVAQPIQLSAKSRGIVHTPSRDLAYELRSLGVELNNEYKMLGQTNRIIKLLQELFAELPEVAEKLDEDEAAITGLRQDANEREKQNDEWARNITFSAKVGVVFKDELSISPKGVTWKGKNYPLETITRVIWGGVRHSVNGVPTGTEYTIGIGDSRGCISIKIRREATYSKFIDAVWRAVGVRLIFDMLGALKEGHSFNFGEITVEDSHVTLVRHKFLGANERVRLPWHDVHVWSADGGFVIGAQTDKKVYSSASYIHVWNTHILEYVILGGFKKGVNKLSDYLKD